MSQSAAAVHPGGKFLTFFLAGEEYGVEILKVHEIIGMLPITRVPRAPAYIRGVVNLRGKVISIVDLREKFGMERDPALVQTCIVVVQVRGVQLGLVVDTVSEVALIPSAEIEAPPSFGGDVPTDFLLGVGKCNGGVKLLLDIDKVLTTAEAVQAGAAVQDATDAAVA
jgi:purine-binding chemotaxis protein CheW